MNKDEIIGLIQNELNKFAKSNNIQKIVQTEIEKQFKSTKTKKEMIDISSKVIVELFKTFYLKKSFWENNIKNVK
jgi:hypothetical protein